MLTRMSEPHDDRVRITRTVDTDLPPDELWSLVGDSEAWASWMVDDADVDLDAGGGTVLDDGVQRDVRIDDVDPAGRVVFTWWPHEQPGEMSTVELVVLPAAAGSSLRITETYAAAGLGSVGRAGLGRAGRDARRAGDARHCVLLSRDRVIARPLDDLFAVLADPTRRAVLEHLVHDGPQTATELATQFPSYAPGDRQAPQAARGRDARRADARRPRGALPRHDRAPGRRRQLVAGRERRLGPAGRPPPRPPLSEAAPFERTWSSQARPRGDTR